MHFLQPWGLLGAAALAPVLLAHLMGPKSPNQVSFAPLFLLPQQAMVGRGRLRLKHIVLLGCRALWLLAMVFLAAQLAWQRPSPQKADVKDHAAQVFVVDASASMNYRLGDATLLQRAQQYIRGKLALAAEGELVGLVMTGPKKVRAVSPSGERAGLAQAVGANWPSQGSGVANLAQAVQQAQNMLQQTPGPKEVVVLSDLAANAMAKAPGSLWRGNAAAKVVWVDVASRRSLPHEGLAPLDNLAITRLRVLPAHRFEVTLRNYGATAVSNRGLTVAVEGEPSQKGVVSVPGHATLRKVFAVRGGHPKAVAVRAQLQAPDGHGTQDGYSADDSLSQSLRFDAPTRVLAVDGAPHSRSRQSEFFYGERALAQVPADAQGASVQVVPRDALAATLSGADEGSPWDVIVLANVGHISRQEARLLSQASARGVGLVVAMGDQVQLSQGHDEDTEAYGTFMPFELRDVAWGGAQGALGEMLLGHEVLLGLGDAAVASLRRSRARQYVFVGPGSEPQAQVIMAYEGGAPALIEAPARPGRGAVLLWTSSLDADWTDVPMMGVFVPLMQRLVARAKPQGAVVPDGDGNPGEDKYRDESGESDFTPIDPKLLLALGEGRDQALRPEDSAQNGDEQSLSKWLGYTLLAAVMLELLLAAPKNPARGWLGSRKATGEAEIRPFWRQAQL